MDWLFGSVDERRKECQAAKLIKNRRRHLKKALGKQEEELARLLNCSKPQESLEESIGETG